MKNILGIVFFGLIVIITNFFMKEEEPTQKKNPILNARIVELEKQKAMLMKDVRAISTQNSADIKAIKAKRK